MRNYELIKAIYDRCPDMAKYPKEYSIDQIFDRTQDIIDLIEKERPELKKDRFWEGGYLPPKTHAEWMEEMKKYPHRDNHMD